tara:strand:+ start:4354 stop:5103 length:750 start_codon:yes stop_codon:yes gene_type:complete
MEVVMEEYTATTLERARHVLKKFPLSSGAKMAIGKDLEYGYTWAALEQNKRALTAELPPRKPGVFTVFSLEGHTLNLTGKALKQMIENARTRHRNTQARINAHATRSTYFTKNDPRKIAHDTASAKRTQRDYQARIRNTFRIAGWGDAEFTFADESDYRTDRRRGDVAETPDDTAPVADGKQTATGSAISDQRAGTTGAIDSGLSTAERSGPQLQPRNETVVWVADGRDGHNRKRIVVRAGATDLTGEL